MLYSTMLYSIHKLYNTMLCNSQGMLYNTMPYNTCHIAMLYNRQGMLYNTLLYNTCYIAWCYITCTLLYNTSW
jgi:hypothetical protein